MKTKEKVLKLKKEGKSIQEISQELSVSIQNVYKHLKSEKDKKEKSNRVINLTELDIERLSERIYLKIFSHF
mgnify:CR=1 FL=1|tara:strand:+ start:232 stop:447 length:216 start_codon:yes stop_codon:yes gene_type:complete